MILKRLVATDSGRLDKVIVKQFPEISRVVIQRLIDAGKICVDEKTITDRSYLVQAGQMVKFDYARPQLKPQPEIVLKRIYEDEEVLIIDKPAGLVVHTTPSQQKDSVAAGLLAMIPDLARVGPDAFRPGIVHRLDADTSGILLIAKTPASYEYLKEQFQTRKILKEYVALVHDRLRTPHAVFDQPIGRRVGEGKFRTGIGRPAMTEYWIEQTLTDGIDTYSLVRVQLHTGRTHQIRVHFAAAGHPVAGDRLYGGRFKKSDKRLFSRQFLHAHRLRLRLPSGAEREFQSELPADLQAALDQLKKF